MSEQTSRGKKTNMEDTRVNKLRTFKIEFADRTLEKTNDFMRRVDIWREGEALVDTGTITSHTTLPLREYRERVAKAFEEMGGKLYSLKEIIE